MKVLLLDYELKVLTIKSSIYLLEINSWHLVNNIFNEMPNQARLKFTIDSKFFSFSVLVISKTDVQCKKKDRVIVDICKFNKLVYPDSYLLPLQSEIIANI